MTRFFSLLAIFTSVTAFAEDAWRQSYDAGYTDRQGAYAGGSEIMHLVAHKGRLYAANGYWVDARWVIPPDAEKQSAQVLRLDRLDGEWQVDLDAGRENEFDLFYMKGNILKSVTFTRDANGERLAEPVNLLIFASGSNFERGGAVSTWVRSDESSQWTHTLVRHGSSNGGVRWVPRDIEIYRDRVTGRERIFLLLGNPGVTSGVYDPTLPGKIRWDRHVEFPFLTSGSLRTRPLGLTRANGALFLSEGSSIHRREDGPRPRYTEILDLEEDTDTDVGGVRGLTTIDNPNGPGESILFLWAPGGRSRSQVKRLDPDGRGGYTLHDEASMADLMEKRLGADVTYTLGAHNRMLEITHPETGETLPIVGFQGNLRGRNEIIWPGSRLYAGALYAIRSRDGSYRLCEVNNEYSRGKPILVSPRAFCPSPFGDGGLFIGGHDSSRRISDDMAWIFHAPLEVALGLRRGADSIVKPVESPVDPRWLEGPVYELRIYHAREHRFGDLVDRFRQHTDRLFKRHGMKPLGYWAPSEGTAKNRRRFVYLLKHDSRYAAFRSWQHFTMDREWEAVLDRPKFQGLLSEKPTSIFLTEHEGSQIAKSSVGANDGAFELRTWVARDDQREEVESLYAQQVTAHFAEYDVEPIGSWRPFDRPQSENTLIAILRHSSRAQASKSWAALEKKSGALLVRLARAPESLFLRPVEISASGSSKKR